MKLLTKIITLMILFIFISSCRKKVEEVDENFLGTWRSNNLGCNISIDIVIDEKSNYYKYCDGLIVEAAGVAKIRQYKNDKNKDLLIIGKKQFEINEYPVSSFDTIAYYKVVLDGITFRREY
jgi:hypothetical protein